MASATFYRLLNGAPEPDQVFDPALIPTSDQKDALAGTNGTPSSSNEYVTDSDPRILTQAENDGIGAAPNAITAANPAADKQYVDDQITAVATGLSWKDAVDFEVEYVKTTTGAPTGTSAAGEIVLNTADDQYYTDDGGGGWNAATNATTGERFIHKDDGTDTSGDNGAHTADGKIYDFNGATFDEDTPEEGDAVCTLDEDRKWVYNGSDWVFMESLQQHNQLAGIQGGNGSDEYFHLTSAEDAALNAATTLSASNPPQTLDDRDKMPTVYQFAHRGGFAAGTTQDIFEPSGSLTDLRMPDDGSIVKIVSMISGAAPSAGTCTVKPQLNSADFTGTSLNLTIDSSTANQHEKASIAPNTTNHTFSQGDTLGIEYESDGSWDATTVDIITYLYVVFDG